jgi:hypothetical protein
LRYPRDASTFLLQPAWLNNGASRTFAMPRHVGDWRTSQDLEASQNGDDEPEPKNRDGFQSADDCDNRTTMIVLQYRSRAAIDQRAGRRIPDGIQC